MKGFTEDHMYAVAQLISKELSQGPDDLKLDVEWHWGGYGCNTKDQLYKRLKEMDRKRLEEMCIEILIDLIE